MMSLRISINWSLRARIISADYQKTGSMRKVALAEKLFEIKEIQD
jgi:hypothetical protein